MYSRLTKDAGEKSFFLFGPRGTGKTTWVKNAFAAATYLDLLDSALFNDLMAQPGRLAGYITGTAPATVVIDEVQRIPGLLNEVHRLIEEQRCRFVLTGSSPRKLRKGGYNLLAGRALNRGFFPLTAHELGADFNLEHSVQYGQLPGAYVDADPRGFLESYVRTYLEQEVQAEGLTRNLSAFARFLESASFSQGSTLNVSAISRECAVERKVVEHYFAILEELLIAYRIPVFAKKAKRRLVAHNKFYFFDAGVYRTLRPAGPLDSPEEIGGIALETLVLQDIMAVNAYCNCGYTLHYWRTAAGREVDIVLYGENGIIAVEVKRSARVDAKMLSGLHAFCADYPMARPYFVYCGERQMKLGDITVVPVEMFLKNLPDLLGKLHVGS